MHTIDTLDGGRAHDILTNEALMTANRIELLASTRQGAERLGAMRRAADLTIAV